MARGSGLVVLGRMERHARGGHALPCTRALDVLNTNQDAVLVNAVVLRAAGMTATLAPPCTYPVQRWIRAGERVTVVNDRMLGRPRTQPPGAVRPFEGRLRALDALPDTPPALHFTVTVMDVPGTLEVPVVQLASDARGRLFHMPELG